VYLDGLLVFCLLDFSLSLSHTLACIHTLYLSPFLALPLFLYLSLPLSFISITLHLFIFYYFTHSFISPLPSPSYFLSLIPLTSSLHHTTPHCTTPHHTTLTVLTALNSASHSVAVLSAVEVRMIDWEHRRVSRKKGREDALLTQNLGTLD
jgi:hypothetical protein